MWGPAGPKTIFPRMHLLLLSFVFGVRAGSLLASVFSDSMVLQRGVVNAIWGYTSAGATVNVSLNGVVAASAVADPTGLYRAQLPPRNASLVASTLSVASSAGGSFTISDVLFGDVLLCSGQSS